MKNKKFIFAALPAVALLFGAFSFNLFGENKGYINAEAIDYDRDNRSITINDNGSVSATFTISENSLDMKGWLLCLFSAQPSFDPSTRKITNSNDVHPSNTDSCVHYFFVANTSKNGVMNVTWSADAKDQKGAENWTAEEATGTQKEGNRLQDLIDDQDWYLVIGPRHYEPSWGGCILPTKGYWENCDFYFSRKSSLSGTTPSGEMYIDLTQLTSWESDSYIAVEFVDNNSHSAFSTFASLDDEHVYVASYELSFTPTQMRAMKFNKNSSIPEETNVVKRGDLVTFHQSGIISVNESTDTFDTFAVTQGLTSNVTLDRIKYEGGHKVYFNNQVALVANDKFVISYDESTYNTFTVRSEVTNTFTTEDNKIKATAAGSFALFFDTTNNTLKISTTAYEAAETWASQFLGSGCSNTKSKWEYNEGAYNVLSSDAKDILLNVAHKDHKLELTNDVDKAIQRYDFLIIYHGYNDYIGRKDADKIPSNPRIASVTTSDNNVAIIITVTAAISLVAVGSLLIIKKKHHE